jgi:hypothetical protein
MRGCNVNLQVGSNSRCPALVDCLMSISEGDDADALLATIIERAADPRDFLPDQSKLTAVVDYLNARLRFDGMELQAHGPAFRLAAVGQHPHVVGHLAGKADALDFDTVRRDLDRALAAVDTDPEDAVTAACSVLENMCRSILIEVGLPLPSKKDLGGLYRAVRDPLGISPEKSDIPPAIVDDVRKVLSGLVTCVEGIGALRTHAGDAHGRERGYRRIDPRIARLSVHAASTIALFLMDTWQQKFPTKQLERH